MGTLPAFCLRRTKLGVAIADRRQVIEPRVDVALAGDALMAKSGLIELRSERAAGEVGRRPRVARNLTVQPQGTHSTTGEVSISLGDGGGKIIRLYPRAVAFQQNPTLSKWDKKGEYNVIRFPKLPR